MKGVFPSRAELDLALSCTEVSKRLDDNRGGWTDMLPFLGPLLIALEKSAVSSLPALLEPVLCDDSRDFKRLQRFVGNYKKPIDFWGSLRGVGLSEEETKVELEWYNLFLKCQGVALGSCLPKFADFVSNNPKIDLESLRKELIGLLSKKKGLKLYSNPIAIIEAYTSWEKLIAACPGLLNAADAICDKLEKLREFDAKLSEKIQNELNDKFKKLYTVNKGSVTLNDVAAVLNDIKSLPEVDPLLGKSV